MLFNFKGNGLFPKITRSCSRSPGAPGDGSEGRYRELSIDGKEEARDLQAQSPQLTEDNRPESRGLQLKAYP